MPTVFSQSHHDPDQRPSKPPPKVPLSALLWLPLSLLFGVGIVYAAKFGYEHATSELDALPHPTAANETLSEPFDFDPGDDPIVLALERKSLEDHLSAAPGSQGSGTIIEPQPLRLRIVERSQNLARVLVVDGSLAGQRFWTRADRILKAKRTPQE